jgi:hypothetical protein
MQQEKGAQQIKSPSRGLWYNSVNSKARLNCPYFNDNPARAGLGGANFSGCYYMN